MATAHDPNRINKDLFLQGALSLTQFNIDGHLVTVIGEVHLLAYKDCSSQPATTVARYVLGSASDQSLKVLLEYVPGLKDLSPLIGSKNMADVYKALTEARLGQKMIGFDLRSTFLRPKDQEVLYHQPTLIETLDAQTAAGVFVHAIPAAVVPQLAPDPKLIKDQGQFGYLQHFLADLGAHAQATLAAMERWDVDPKSRRETVVMIQYLWAKVSDYAIVREIFTQARGGNVVVLCGERHAVNLRAIFGKSLFGLEAKKNDDCLNLRGAYLRI